MTRSRDVGKYARAVQRVVDRAIRPASDDPYVRYRGDPCGFAESLVDPETGELFALYDVQRRFLEEALALTPSGRLPYPELLFSAPKKSGKTTFAAIVVLYCVRVIGGRNAEGYCCANDYDQSVGRVFAALVKILAATPWTRGTFTNSPQDLVTFPQTGATIQALPNDYAGAAGANPVITCFDELWAYTSERARRLFDEMVPVPTRRVSVRLTTTYAGFEGESQLLEELYTKLVKGEEMAPAMYRAEGLFGLWSHGPIAPWQTDAWRDQMRGQLRANAFLRLIENRFVSSESGFIELDWWDECVDPDLRPVVRDEGLPVWCGVDASVKRDHTAVVAVAWDRETERVRLVAHRIFKPRPDDPLDFEGTIERTLVEWRARFRMRSVRYDPYQMVSSAQRLAAAGVPMEEFPQSSPNLTDASSNLYELIKGRNLWAYPDPELRQAVGHAVAKETPRGWRIAKEKASKKIDVVVALAMAALACVQENTGAEQPTDITLPRLLRREFRGGHATQEYYTSAHY